jgi:DNA-binding NarL/FixJ family response regulator
VVADHHTMVAEAFRSALTSAGIEVLGVAGTASEALALLTVSDDPVVVVVDEGLSDGDGEALTEIRHHAPQARVVILAERADRSAVQAAVDAGCVGIVEKTESFERLSETIRDAGRGHLAIPLASLRALADRPPEGPALTGRERQVLGLVAAGLSTRSIAMRLGIEVNTARTHLQRAIRKLGAHSRFEAVARARRQGLLA